MPFVFNPVTGKLDFVNPPTTDASLLTSGTLADARLSSNVSLNNINNNFTATQTITAPANTSALTASYSVTGTNTTPLLDLSGTWNTTGIARGILLNITDTASAATSRLLDLRYQGATSFAIGKDGSWTFNSTANSGAGSGSLTPGNTPLFNLVQSTGLRSSLSPTTLTFFTAIGNTNPVLLTADAANTLAVRNGTNAQAFRLYNTFTDASNYERAFMRWTSNTLEIGTEAGGTGTGRDLRLLANGIARVTCSNSITLSPTGTANVTIASGIALILSTGNLRQATSVTPASATATGTTGDIQWDANYVYVCTATNTWKRSAIATW
jgi:hypothetical protein